MGNLISCSNGICINNKTCCKCNRTYGDYGLNYICLVIGKGKYNNRYMCFDCIYNTIDNNKKDNKYKTFDTIT